MTSPKLQFYRTLRIGFLRLPIIGKILALRQLKKLLPLSMLHRHGYIVGKSGSGKSEFLKLLVLLLKMTANLLPWASKIEQNRSVLLLDPHGDVASECARQRCFYAEYQKSKGKGISGNMVFISPSLGDRVFPTLNPFDIRNKGYGECEIEVIAQNLTRAFTAMLSKGDVTLSLHMKTLLTPMLTVLLTLSNESESPMTFFDLVRFLDEERNHDLVEAGQNLSNEGQRHFFANLFPDRKFMATKFSLKTKLASLLNSQMFVELLSRGHSTWDLEALLNSGKTVIVSASKSDLGAEVSEMYGRTITALVQSYVLMRGRSGHQKKYPPIFFILDEAASFITEDIKTILTESRKFGLHLILANQLAKQGIGTEFHNTIMGNTALKIIGNAGSDTKRIMAKECETGLPIFQDLPVGTFVLKRDAEPALRVRMPRFWLGKKGAVTSREWDEMKRDQLSRYYRTSLHSDHDTTQLREEIESERSDSGKAHNSNLGLPRPIFDFSLHHVATPHQTTNLHSSGVGEISVSHQQPIPSSGIGEHSFDSSSDTAVIRNVTP